MRLLQYNHDREFSLTQFSDNIPRYAILSHTWGPEEVTFKDMVEGNGTSKTGFDKIRFCGEQARRDGLQYFWVDTCCIDKSNSTELTEAINSMFCWYRNAARCYVYLSDVSISACNTNDKSNPLYWQLMFQKSRWFTRGWTLQELIAPTSVEFFSKEGGLFGNKTSLEGYICEITGIPTKALQGGSLSHFSVIERMSWSEKRETTRKEDIAYSLLGIFDINMPLIYGEGKEKALRRLREEIDKASKGIRREDFSVSFSLSNVSNTEHFVAREEELTEIHTKLSGDGSRRTVVLHGLGGMGKTQLAVAYAKRYKDSYSAIFWLNIKDEDSLKQSFARIARQILREHPSAPWLSKVDMKNLDEVIDAVKAWQGLPYNTRWLMIYDNYDNPRLASNTDPTAVDITKFLPEIYQGSVLVTTRSSEVEIGHLIQVTKLVDIRDCLRILLNTSRREGLMDNVDATKLAKKLDGLPLALVTAGAYLKQAAISFADYLRLYEKSWAKLQKTSPVLSSYEDRTLYSTWNISFEYVERRNVLSAQLLRLWAYLDNQDIWFELLQHSGPEDPDWIRELMEDELSFHEAMRVLSDHGLVEVDRPSQELLESQGYSIHGCVHSWTIHVLNREWDYNLARLAIRFVGSHVPGEQATRPWLIRRRLLQHVARCSSIIVDGLVIDDDMAWICHNLGDFYFYQENSAEAEQMYRRALQVKEKVLGIEHISTLDTVNKLGNAYATQGKLVLAEQMFERALQGKEKILHAEHASILDTVNNLGNLFTQQGKFALAEQMYERALRGSEKVLGIEHTSTLSTVNNLGSFYIGQGKLALAEQMYVRALRGREKALGAEHTLTLSTVCNLGNLYVDQGKLTLAEQMYQQALRGYEKELGAEHKLTLDTVNNLGLLFKDQGKLVLAEQMFERALQGKEKVLGTEHISTLDTVNNLGNLYADQDKLAKAEQMYERALRGKEKALGAEHTSTLSIVNNLGLLFSRQNKLALAEQMYDRALRGNEKVLGVDHTSMLATVSNLGNLYVDQGKFALAEQMYERALRGYEKALGADNIMTYIPALNTLSGLGSLFQHQANFAKATTIYSKALAGYNKVVGPDHPTSNRLREIIQVLESMTETDALKE
ncbi:hypothetical protein BGZ60DRAFT_530945 [Tricladium varicosporioides]|nr:hypothetical protein BGZ60DRAFT_530945 [Hymenoscyphus varicosporioides]